jgi:UDP-N-acetylmuramoyl-tripeptide--D-alanyl-D-alanine ligase
MLELGDFSRAEHEHLADAVGESADRLYTCGTFSKYLFNAVPRHLQGAHADTSSALAPIIAADLQPGDAVLVKGSLGSRMKLIVDSLTGLVAAGCP